MNDDELLQRALDGEDVPGLDERLRTEPALARRLLELARDEALLTELDAAVPRPKRNLIWGVAAMAATLLLSLAVLMNLQEPDTTTPLVRQLGSESYDEREKAHESLVAMGETARPALQEASKSADPEVAIRAVAILSRLDRGNRVEDLTRLLAAEPGRADLYAQRAAALLALSRVQEAQADAESALRLQPDLAQAYLVRGEAVRSLGRFESALADFSRAIELQPTLAEAYLSRGAAVRALGRHDEALADFTRAIELQPAQAEAHVELGAVLIEQKRYEEALRAFDEAIRLDPRSADALLNRGQIHLKEGRFEDAIADFTEALRVAPAEWTLSEQAKKTLELPDLDEEF